MGGLFAKIPVTATTMWIGSLAIAGIPYFAGYWSKDAILESAFAAGSPVAFYAFVCGTAAAFLTAFYSWRLLILTFHGTSRADHHVLDHAHESPPTMLGPLILLSLGAIFAGWWFHDQFIGDGHDAYWQGAIFTGPTNHIIEQIERTPFLIGILPTATGVLGIALAYWFYMLDTSIPARRAQNFAPLYRFLLNKWYFDELYQFLFVRPAVWLANELWQIGDVTIIDGVPNGLAAMAEGGSEQIVRIQTGSIAVYAFTMLIGVVALVSFFIVAR
jgi:NADH-quinone oxidoreductase subunit L